MIVVYLMTIGRHTGSDDMDVVVACVVVGIYQQRLTILGIAHFFEVVMCDVKQLLMGVLISLTADSNEYS